MEYESAHYYSGSGRGRINKKNTPYLPLTPEEIAQEARLCVEAGASVIHLHARDEKSRPTNHSKVFRSIIQHIRKVKSWRERF
ncbi:MAG: 3-keto-5-aminohexanoate cleavage protein [Deltaproteobacteria bacterium]|nr:MAG: 3-keto-5-aminohexanoate cleavage protein [Deltaproteobacteria bacterium]